MELRLAIALVGNFVAVATLVVIGLRMFAQYHSSGKWAKNVTGLLAGLGMLLLSFSLLISPRNAEALSRIARTNAYMVFLIASNILLLSAIAAYGLIAYWKPLRLLHERDIEKERKRELPKVP